MIKSIKKSSPKNKFLASINIEKNIPGMGNSFSAHGMTLEEVKHNVLFYTDQAENLKSGWYVTIKENKKQFPEFDWHDVEIYQADKRKFNGGNKNAGRAAK